MTAKQLELGQATPCCVAPAPIRLERGQPCPPVQDDGGAARGQGCPRSQRRGPFEVPPGDFARPGLVDRGFVERSVAVMRGMPDAERQLREAMSEFIESVRAIDLVYREELNAWATATRERLWLEYFTAEAILHDLTVQR